MLIDYIAPLSPQLILCNIAEKKLGLPKSYRSQHGDALVLDLEDSAPPSEMATARDLAASKIGWLVKRGLKAYVRINRSPHL